MKRTSAMSGFGRTLVMVSRSDIGLVLAGMGVPSLVIISVMSRSMVAAGVIVVG